MSLKLYKNDVIEWVVAESPEDATAIMLSEKMHYDDPPEWEELPMDSKWTLFGQFTDDGKDLTLTAAEWIARQGRGFLGTTEF